MKFKRIASVILALMLVTSCVCSTVQATDTATDYNEYKKMLADTTAENNYGLEDTVNEGKILQAWNWSYENVIAQMETVAKQGFTTIQVSPPNEIKMPTKDVNVCEPDNSNGWWMFYQPAGFQLNESEDNALGTKAQFVEMCKKAEDYGVKILVDAVINHMGTDDDHVGDPYNNISVNPMDHVNPRAQEFEPELIAAKAFHSPWVDCTYVENMGQKMPQYNADWSQKFNSNCKNCKAPLTQVKCNSCGTYNYIENPNSSATVYDITLSNTRHCTSGLPDLDTSLQLVQDTIYDYLVELVEAGADGFRIDAAKHIETSEDIPEFASDFWEDTLIKVREKYSDREIFAYGEILNKCGDGRPFSMYTKMMDVTDSGSYWGIKDAVCNNGNNGNSTPAYPNANFTKENVIQWNESHDTYIDGSTSFLNVEQRDKIWALTAARQTITGVYFARPDDAAGNGRAEIEAICSNIKLGEARVTSWANPAVKAVNQFDNYFGDAAESASVQNKMTIIERGGLGATIVNLGGTTGNANMFITTLADGKYVDTLTGNVFRVNDGILKGSIGETGIACIYYAEDRAPEFPVYDIENDGFPTRDGFNTVVFTDSYNWNSVCVHYWSTDGGLSTSWPGIQMNYGITNEMDQKQYYAFVPEECDMVIINNGGNGIQTVDTALSGHTAYYPESVNGEGKYTLGTFDTKWNIYDPLSEYSLGDVDRNGTVNISDVTLIQKALIDLAEIDKHQRVIADYNKSGTVNIKDATAIQYKLAGIE